MEAILPLLGLPLKKNTGKMMFTRYFPENTRYSRKNTHERVLHFTFYPVFPGFYPVFPDADARSGVFYDHHDRAVVRHPFPRRQGAKVLSCTVRATRCHAREFQESQAPPRRTSRLKYVREKKPSGLCVGIGRSA